MGSGRVWLPIVLTVAWFAFVFAVFVPDVGRGFVKDDFAWIATARAGLSDPMSIVQPSKPGFFRPLVAASFALNYRWFGLEPRNYGFTNLALYVACAIALVLLIRELHVGWPAAIVGAFAWATNPHGIGMAVLWISGRTSLLLTLTSVLCALAFVRQRRTAGLALFACALASKEEAVMLPLIVAALLMLGTSADRRRVAIDALSMCGVLACYLVLRYRTPAFTLTTAPWFYAPTRDIRLIVRNVLEYVDRGATIGLVVCLVAIAAFRRLPMVGRPEQRAIAAGIAWFALAFVPTVLIPVRSSLYAVFPSVGMAVAVAVVVDLLLRTERMPRHQVVFAAALASVVVCAPIYRQRNAPWVEAARVSRRVMRVISTDVDGRYSRGLIVLEDERTRISNFRDAFGSLATEAVQLVTGQPLEAEVLVPTSTDRVEVPQANTVAWYKLENGAVKRIE